MSQISEEQTNKALDGVFFPFFKDVLTGSPTMRTLTLIELNEILRRALEAADDPVVDLELEVEDLDLTVSGFVPSPSKVTSDSASAPHAIRVPHGTVKISVRIPGRILAAFKTRAVERRQPYQKLLNQALRDTVKGWEAAAKA